MGPMAELLMKYITVHKDIEIISRGLIVLFPEPVNPKAIAVMRQKGIILDNRTSVPLTEEDIPEGTLILAIGNKEKEMVIETYAPDDLFTVSECCESMIEWLKKVDNKLTMLENEQDDADV